MFVWAPLPKNYKKMGSMKFAKNLMINADVAVAPGLAFGKNLPESESIPEEKTFPKSSILLVERRNRILHRSLLDHAQCSCFSLYTYKNGVAAYGIGSLYAHHGRHLFLGRVRGDHLFLHSTLAVHANLMLWCILHPRRAPCGPKSTVLSACQRVARSHVHVARPALDQPGSSAGAGTI